MGRSVALGFAPPAGVGEGKASEDDLIFIEQNDLAPAGSVLEGGEFKMGKGQIRRVRIEPPRGPVGRP